LQHTKRAGGWIAAEIVLQYQARLRYVVRIANVDRHLHHVLQVSAAFGQSELQILHHHLGLRLEVVRWQYLAGGIGGDLAGAEDQLISPLRSPRGNN
jgi:hypothetical protein